MSNTVADDEAVRLVERLRDATNSHDPDGVAACFTPDYCSETPLHPARSFTGETKYAGTSKRSSPSFPTSQQNCSAVLSTPPRSGQNGSTAEPAEMAHHTPCAAQ